MRRASDGEPSPSNNGIGHHRRRRHNWGERNGKAFLLNRGVLFSKDAALAVATVIPIVYVAYVIPPSRIIGKNPKIERAAAVVLAALVAIAEALMIVVVNTGGIATTDSALLWIAGGAGVLALVLMLISIARRPFEGVIPGRGSAVAPAQRTPAQATTVTPSGSTEVRVHPHGGPSVRVDVPSLGVADVSVTVN